MEFIKLTENQFTPETEILNHKSRLGIKVQSVVLPSERELYIIKREAQFMDWLQNKVHNVNFAYHKINSKYTGDTERINWNNNKMQNQRFVQTKNLYKDKEE
jgi:hypothetical protein